MGAITTLLFPPSEASPSDVLMGDIGGDYILNETLKKCLRVDEKSIPDGAFQTSSGNRTWSDAKNIAYVNTAGAKDYMIVWKDSPDKYDIKNTSQDAYISDYLIESDGKFFLLYSHEKNSVYGIILGTGKIPYSEYRFIHDVLGLSTNEYPLMYGGDRPSYSPGYHTTESSYHGHSG